MSGDQETITTQADQAQETLPPAEATPSPHANGGGQQPEETETVFTQAQLDKLLKERLSRAEKATEQKFLEQLGVGSVSDIKKALNTLKEVEDSQKSEMEKLTERYSKAEQTAAQLQDQLTKERQDRLIEREAVKLGFFDVTDALALVNRQGLKGDLDEGQAKTVLADLLKSKPHLAKAADAEQPSPKPKAPDIRASNGNGSGQSAVMDITHLLPAALRRNLPKT